MDTGKVGAKIASILFCSIVGIGMGAIGYLMSSVMFPEWFDLWYEFEEAGKVFLVLCILLNIGIYAGAIALISAPFWIGDNDG